MRKTIITIGLAIAVVGITFADPADVYVRPQWYQIAVTTGTNVVLSSSNNYFYEATFYATRFVTNNAVGQGNTNIVYLGSLDTPGNLLSTNLPAIISTGLTSNQSLTITAPVGVRYNLADYYVVGTTGDKVTIKLLSR